MQSSSDVAVMDTACLSIEQTVRRSLVHKRSLENVLLTEIRACADDRFVCAGRAPTAHWFFNDAGRTPHKDILFYTELGRQASLAISHAFLDARPEDIFVFEGSEAAVTEAVWAESFDTPPDLVVVEVKIREITRRRNNAVSRVVAEYLMSIGAACVFRGTGAWTIQPAALFHRLRRMSPLRSTPSPGGAVCYDTDPDGEGVRRSSVDNVVISRPAHVDNPARFVASLIVDHRHPYFFDHPCDHVPGMLLLEGCAQVALAAFAEVTSVPRWALGIGAYDVNFAQFVECDLPTTLTARVNAGQPQDGGLLRSTVEVTIFQGDVVAGTATMRMASPVRV